MHVFRIPTRNESQHAAYLCELSSALASGTSRPVPSIDRAPFCPHVSLSSSLSLSLPRSFSTCLCSRVRLLAPLPLQLLLVLLQLIRQCARAVRITFARLNTHTSTHAIYTCTSFHSSFASSALGAKTSFNVFCVPQFRRFSFEISLTGINWLRQLFLG